MTKVYILGCIFLLPHKNFELHYMPFFEKTHFAAGALILFSLSHSLCRVYMIYLYFSVIYFIKNLI